MHFTDLLVERIREAFPGRSVVFAEPPGVVVTFPPDHPGIGAIEIHDEHDELTVIVGRVTHCHFSPHNYTGFTDDEMAVALVEDTVSFLADLFSDKVVFWGAHGASGGTYRVGDTPGNIIEPWGPRYVWSGEYHGV